MSCISAGVASGDEELIGWLSEAAPETRNRLVQSEVVASRMRKRVVEGWVGSRVGEGETGSACPHADLSRERSKDRNTKRCSNFREFSPINRT